MSETEQNWDKMALAYEDFTSGTDSYSCQIEWPCIQKMLPPLSGKTVIDLGCGTGRFTFWLEKEGARRMVGADIADNMLSIAQKKAQETGSRAVFMKADISAPFTDEKFDVLFSSTVTHYIQDLNALFRLIHGMLNQEGVAVLSVMHPVYTAQYPIRHDSVFPTDDEWTIRYLDRRERAYIQPWIEYNDSIDNFLSRSYHHTFSDYGNAIIGAGLEIVEMQEPLPPEEWKEKNPERYDGFIETPSFLILKLKKPA
ncbi:MAG: class I SAM-dependent methyltransferase [Eubacteriales bacterium]|nr:class I SAM-dependent methyltransferase [Eubacteriales bacterium]